MAYCSKVLRCRHGTKSVIPRWVMHCSMRCPTSTFILRRRTTFCATTVWLLAGTTILGYKMISRTAGIMWVLVFNGAPRFSGINMALSQAFVQAVTAHKVTVVQQHLHDIATDLGSAASLVQLSDNAAQAYQAVLDADLI